MGNTCASVHIARIGSKPDPIDGIVRAYKTLGFERIDTAAPDGGKHVILVRHDGDAFLSVYDSDNADLDTGESTWRPLFDHADDYERTAYEEHSVLNWFRGISQTDGGLNAQKMSLQWCRNVVRMVTPHMWICRELLAKVDREQLEAVAELTESNGAFRIALRSGRGLDDIELALLPILPVESARLRIS